MKISRSWLQFGYSMAHTGLKLLNDKGAKSLILVPGAGLEPARTLPGPRDFKSTSYCHHQQLWSTKSKYQHDFWRWYFSLVLLGCSEFSYSDSYSKTTRAGVFEPPLSPCFLPSAVTPQPTA